MSRAGLLLAAALLAPVATPIATADELSGADKLRVVYSPQFAWTKDGLPLVNVRVAEGREQVVITAPRGGGVRLQPDGEGGPEVRAGATWTVRLVPRTASPAKVHWNVVVARIAPKDGERLRETLELWRSRGLQPRTLETGALFASRGEVLDSRHVLVAVSSRPDEAGARAEAASLSAKYHLVASVHPHLAERPRGLVEAVDERGATVRNDAILWFAPDAGQLLELKDVDREGGGRETRRYFGRLYVTVDSRGKLAVVNAVPEDRLLAGLVPAEMMPSAAPEALKAQAVAARNELLAKIGTRHLTDPYRLCSTQHCQVYAGAGHEDPRASAAVQATRGELLVRQDDGALADTVYSASCGGHTEDNDLAWGGAPDPALRGRLDGDAAVERALAPLKPRVEEAELGSWLARPLDAEPRPYCARPRGATSNWRWRKTIDLATAVARAGVGPWRKVEVLSRGVSGRATRLRVVGHKGTQEIRGELQIRRALGNLKSALFTLAERRGADGSLLELIATGGGHGHGIGMCQMGAIGMAEAGASYPQILDHYYRGTRLRKLY